MEIELAPFQDVLRRKMTGRDNSVLATCTLPMACPPLRLASCALSLRKLEQPVAEKLDSLRNSNRTADPAHTKSKVYICVRFGSGSSQ